MAADQVKQSQQALEVAREAPSSADINQTQAALEHIAFPPNNVWATQVCLEVLFPADGFAPPASRRNHSFVGAWQGTGHEDNASFSF